MTQSDEDAKAALAAFNELGPQYSDAVVDSFLAKVDEHLAAQRQPEPTHYAPDVRVVRDPFGSPVLDKNGKVQFEPVPYAGRVPAKPTGAGMQIAKLVLTLVFSIPLSAIAIVNGGLIAFTIAWAGIVLVAIAFGGRLPGEDGKK
jgi:hypothetical protein